MTCGRDRQQTGPECRHTSGHLWAHTLNSSNYDLKGLDQSWVKQIRRFIPGEAFPYRSRNALTSGEEQEVLYIQKPGKSVMTGSAR
uniref:Transposase n=1 Tax=Steinernema glaseri TaxID=37863 RepID=A0A1I8A7K5_9BILA